MIFNCVCTHVCVHCYFHIILCHVSYNINSYKEQRTVIVYGVFFCLQMAFKADPDEKNERVCEAEWNNCAYTITSLGTYTVHCTQLTICTYGVMSCRLNRVVYCLLFTVYCLLFTVVLYALYRNECQTTGAVFTINSVFTSGIIIHSDIDVVYR